jgi:hypothetical protein
MGCRKVSTWADLSRSIGMRSRRERATFEVFPEMEQEEAFCKTIPTTSR